MAGLVKGLVERIRKWKAAIHLLESAQYDMEYIQYCVEQEQTVSKLEASLHESDDPNEIAQKTLKTACEFYGAEWVGILDVDLELDVWTPLWWYNPKAYDKTKQLFGEFELAKFMPNWVKALNDGTPVIITDTKPVQYEHPNEYEVYKRLGVESVIGCPFAPNPVGFLAIKNPTRYQTRSSALKRERDMVGNVHTVKHNKADWIVVDETHESIVSKELFSEAASRMKEYKEFVPPTSGRNLLRRKVICGTCGFAMSLSNTKNAKYHCRTSHLDTDFDCTSEGILQADIHEMVVTLIRTYAAYAVSLEHLMRLQTERLQAEKKQARRELAVLQSRKGQLEKALQDLYEKLIDGTIDKETYLSHKASNQTQMQELTEQMNRLEQSTQANPEQGGAFIQKYKEYAELETLTGEIANNVVKRVTVYKDGGIEIELALRDELEALLTCLETVDVAS